MKNSIIYIYEKLKSSMWFIPVTMTLISPFFAILIFQLDIHLSRIGKEMFGWIWTGDPNAASELFAALVTSLVTMCTLLFSLTMLVLTVVSQQYGSHVLRVFKSSQFTKWVLGWFIGSVVYCLFIITFLSTLGNADFHPQLSMIIGIGLMVVSFIIFIVFIHHMTNSIQSEHIIETVTKELRKKIEDLQKRETKYEEASKLLINRIDENNPIALSSSGYIQSIDEKSLVKLAEKSNNIFLLPYRIGEFVYRDVPILFADNSINKEEFVKDIQNCFLVGFERMPKDDFEFNLEQLIEICLKALSPGINDAYIAMTAIDHLGDALTLLSIRRFPPQCYKDSQGKLRVISRRFTYDSFIAAAINPIKQNAKSQPQVLIRLMDTVERVLGVTEDREKQSILKIHARNVYNTGKRNFTEPEDVADLEERMVRINKII